MKMFTHFLFRFQQYTTMMQRHTAKTHMLAIVTSNCKQQQKQIIKQCDNTYTPRTYMYVHCASSAYMKVPVLTQNGRIRHFCFGSGGFSGQNLMMNNNK